MGSRKFLVSKFSTFHGVDRLPVSQTCKTCLPIRTNYKIYIISCVLLLNEPLGESLANRGYSCEMEYRGVPLRVTHLDHPFLKAMQPR